LLVDAAEVLPAALGSEVFDFFGKVLGGQPQQPARWRRGVAMVNETLGDAVGERYVARFFRPKAKQEIEQMIGNLRRAFAARIDQLDWMTPQTKHAALDKLAAIRTKVGYPDRWKDHAALEIVRGDAFGNWVRAARWASAVDRARLGKPNDRSTWGNATPQRVVAWNLLEFNEILFTAAFLQPPMFDPEADPAVNYGAIGGAIGHELGHAFDDQGSRFDAGGVLRTWWSEADLQAFRVRTDALVAQYSEYEPLPGIKINGRLTLGENIGDLGGLTIAYTAYQLSLRGKPAPVLDGLTGDQRFFLGWAQIHRSLMRDEALRNQIMSDPHSPARYGVNGVVRNMDAWYSAFDVKPGDALYFAPDQRVRIW
jgi:putative endopeptidase